MLMDWVCAICILFLIHFFINITLNIIQSLNDVFSETVVKGGKDELMSNFRTKIGDGTKDEDLSHVFAYIVIYVTLVIYTIQFTIIYLKRVINMAFLTIISPLVAFTYPIDKIKDGKAQALGVWIKEFMFNALMQPIHMILYWIFVGGAIEFAYANPLYAIAMIGFLKPAEKFVRQLFGLESQSSLSNMSAALGGAAMMNAMKKAGSKAMSKAKSSGGNKDGKTNDKVRTEKESNDDPYASLKENGASEGRNASGTGAANGNTSTTSTQNGSSQGRSGSGSSTSNSSQADKKDIKNSPKRWDGVKGVAKKYVLNKNSGKKILKGALKGAAKVTGAATLGTVGLAAGIATGDMDKAFSGAMAGLAAGNKLGGNLVDGAGNLINGAKSGIGGIRDTFNEGKYGADEAARMKFDEEFKKSEEYKNLMSKYPGQEQTAQEFLNAGITDVSKMEKAMNSGYDTKEAIAYMKMAEKCPDEILYDKENFKTYLASFGIDGANADKIRKALTNFK